MRKLLPRISFIGTLLLVEFLDEFIYGAREAAWPMIRNDLHLTYFQVGLLLSAPNIVGNLVEPVIGILGDIWRRRVLIVGGGLFFSGALCLVAASRGFWSLLIAFIIFYPASGAFVSLSQAVLMDYQPDRHEQNMARWTFAGSLGIVVGPLLLGIITAIGGAWRDLFWGFAVFSFLIVFQTTRYGSLTPAIFARNPLDSPGNSENFLTGVHNAFRALKRVNVIRWLIILEFADLVLDVLHGFLALYFVDVAGLELAQAGLSVAIYTGTGLVGDLLLIPLLEKVESLKYLRRSAAIVLVIFPVFLLLRSPIGKLVFVGLLGFINAGWYAIPKGKLYSEMPGQSGTVMALGNISNLIGSLIPLGIGLLAQNLGLQTAMWCILLGPIALIIGIPRRAGS